MANWILLGADGNVAGQVVTDGRSPAERDNPDKLKTIAVDRLGDLLTERYDATTGRWGADIPKLRASLLDAVDKAREANRAPWMSPLQGQSNIYSEKAREVHDYRFVLGNALATLTIPQRRARFPYAMAEAEATGDALQSVIDRFEAGAATSRVELARIDGIAMRAKAAIRSAATEAAMRAAATINWKSGA